MHFTSTVVVGLACLMQSGVYALPSGDAGAALEPNVTLVSSEQIMLDGTPALYEAFLDTSAAAQEGSGSDATLERRCGSNRHTCSNTNRAQTYYCQQLIDRMKADSGSKLSLKITSRCLTTSNGKCCTSWTKEVSQLESLSVPAALSNGE